MRTIIAGSRNIYDYELVRKAVRLSGFKITEVVSGRARGVDALGELWAERNGVFLKMFPADWQKHGKAAGPIRNAQMADYAEALIAVRALNSRGTQNMIQQARKKGLKVFVLDVGE